MMKVNGEKIGAEFLDFRTFVNGTARLALDHEKGAYLIRYEWANVPEDERSNMFCDPEELVFNADGIGHADFKRNCKDDPLTGERRWWTPSIPCRVEKVPYDTEERKQFEAREKRRSFMRRMQEESAKAEQVAREQAELDHCFKLATIKLSEIGTGDPGKAHKPKPRQAVTVKRAAELCHVTERQILNWEAGTYTPKDWPGRENTKRLLQWQADRVNAQKIGIAIDNAARHGNMDSVSARMPGGLAQHEKQRRSDFYKSIDSYSRDDDND